MVRMPLEKKSPLSASDIEKLIDKGAAVKGESKSDDKKWTNINLRIRKEIVDEINAILKSEFGFNRTSWIVQAIQKEIKRHRESN